MEYTDGELVKYVKYDELRFYQMIIQTECIAVKMECLWNSEDVYSYIDKKRVWEYIPGLQDYRFVPVSNNILAKAEIPFLIFERNRGKCFVEAWREDAGVKLFDFGINLLNTFCRCIY